LSGVAITSEKTDAAAPNRLLVSLSAANNVVVKAKPAIIANLMFLPLLSQLRQVCMSTAGTTFGRPASGDAVALQTKGVARRLRKRAGSTGCDKTLIGLEQMQLLPRKVQYLPMASRPMTRRAGGLRSCAAKGYEAFGDPVAPAALSRRGLVPSIRTTRFRACWQSGHGGRFWVARRYSSRGTGIGCPQKVNTFRGRRLWRTVGCVRVVMSSSIEEDQA
jgi:hypothetical protein